MKNIKLKQVSKMDVQKYKLQHPEHSHLQRNELWDAMGDSMIDASP